MAKRKALGRGINALISESVDEGEQAAHAVDTSNTGIREIALTDIRPNPYQPRLVFEEGALEDLVRSIKEKGVLSPVMVRSAAGGFELISGERRWRASREAGKTTIPAIIRENLSDTEMLELALIENIQREDLNAVETAKSYQSLINAYGYSQEKIALKVGKERSTVANFLRLLKLPERVQALIMAGDISMGHARALLAVKAERELLHLADQIVRKGLSVRAVEKMIKIATSGNAKKKSKDKALSGSRNHRFTAIENGMKQALGTKVSVADKGDAGTIQIEYFSAEEFERISELITKV